MSGGKSWLAASLIPRFWIMNQPYPVALLYKAKFSFAVDEGTARFTQHRADRQQRTTQTEEAAVPFT